MNTELPEFTVVLTTWNRPRKLARALQSIRRQTFKNFELVVILDGPPDPRTIKLVKFLAARDSRIRYVHFATCSNNPALRMNQAMALARAVWIAFQDDDDLWFPNALLDLERASKQYPGMGLIYGSTRFMDARTNSVIDQRFGGEFNLGQLDHANILCNNSAIIRRDVLHAVGGFDESTTLRPFFDWELWIRIGRKYPAIHIDQLIGEVWGFNPDSVGANATADFPAIVRRMGRSRNLPLLDYWSSLRRVTFLTSSNDSMMRLGYIRNLVDAINRRHSRWKARLVQLEHVAPEEVFGSVDVLVVSRLDQVPPGAAVHRRRGMKLVLDYQDGNMPCELDDAHVPDAIFTSSRGRTRFPTRANVFVRDCNCGVFDSDQAGPVIDHIILDLDTILSREGVTAEFASLEVPSIPDASLVLVHRNNELRLFHCLQSIREHPPRCAIEIIVVDDASDDDSKEMVRRRFPEVRWIQNATEIGFTQSARVGRETARGRNVVIFNPDQEVECDTLDGWIGRAAHSGNDR